MSSPGIPLNSGLIEFMKRATTLHFMGTQDYKYHSPIESLQDATLDFLEVIEADQSFLDHLSSRARLKTGGVTFSIARVYHGVPITRDIDQAMKERLGEVFRVHAKMKVNLENPDIPINIIISTPAGTRVGFMFFISLHGRGYRKRDYTRRLSGKRPAFAVGTMNPPLTTLMVNLCTMKPSSRGLYLDPFCGTGGILIEALVQGFPVLGLDIDGSKLEGCRKNLLHFNQRGNGNPVGIHLVQGSIFNLPFRDAPAGGVNGTIRIICTDPPYGRISSLNSRPLRGYITEILQMSLNAKKICFAIPEREKTQLKSVLGEFMVKSPLSFNVEVVPYHHHSSFKRLIVQLVRRPA